MRRTSETRSTLGRSSKLVLGIGAFLLGIAHGASAEPQPSDPTGHSVQATKAVSVVRRIVVSTAERKLAVVEAGRVVRLYPVAVGASESPSPTGQFTIVVKVKSPTWYHGGKVVGPGKTNPLGTRWMGLSRKGYGIHGTNVPESIGHAASHGCIRMRTRDAEELFELVRTGDSVEITRDHATGESAGTSAGR
jgi:lipoprotein-anchoring transpeptidase ErfK/SrfK